MTMSRQCPICEADGKSSSMRLIQINVNEAIVNCEDPECCYPFGTDHTLPLLIKRNYYKSLAQGNESQVRSDAVNISSTYVSVGHGSISDDVSVELDRLLQDQGSAQLDDDFAGFFYDDCINLMDEDHPTQGMVPRIESVQNLVGLTEPINDECTVNLKVVENNLDSVDPSALTHDLGLLPNIQSDIRVVLVDEISELNSIDIPRENVVTIKVLHTAAATTNNVTSKPLASIKTVDTGSRVSKFLKQSIYNADKPPSVLNEQIKDVKKPVKNNNSGAKSYRSRSKAKLLF